MCVCYVNIMTCASRRTGSRKEVKENEHEICNEK